MSDPNHPPTARLTAHAQQRCNEMQVSSKRVKRLVRNPSINHVTWANRWVATSNDDPDIAVVYAVADGQPTVITVLWRSAVPYDRATYRPENA